MKIEGGEQGAEQRRRSIEEQRAAKARADVQHAREVAEVCRVLGTPFCPSFRTKGQGGAHAPHAACCATRGSRADMVACTCRSRVAGAVHADRAFQLTPLFPCTPALMQAHRKASG